MGAAGPLFYSNDPDRQTLHRRVTPSSDQFEDQRERWNLLADALTASLRERSGYSMRTWLQGSYKFGTQIRPVRKGDEFDIDLGVYFEWEGQPTDGEHPPQALKGFVHESLTAYARANPDDVSGVAQAKPRCSRIHFSGSLHIDVPAYHLDPDRDARSLVADGGWEGSDPKSIYVWFRDSFDEAKRERVRRHVKYLKAWAALRFPDEQGRPSSILLTVLVAEAAVAVGQLGPDDEALRDLLEAIVARLDEDISVPNPVDFVEDLIRLSYHEVSVLVERLRTFLDIANRAMVETTAQGAADIWQEAFDHLFPLPDEVALVSDAAAALPAVLTMPEVRATATSRSNANLRYSGTNAIGPIPRNCDIRFEVTNAHALPFGCTVTWIVRNEGSEAENINDLGHRAGEGLVGNERSAYRGRHFMDCIVKVQGRMVAIRRIPVTITGLEMPRRNPAKRPAWNNLRARR